MSIDRTQKDSVYGLSQALIAVSSEPIISRRNPTANDKAPLGQIWVNRTTGITYILSAITANVYTWYAVAQAAASYTAAGALVAGTTLTVTGLSTLTGGATIGTGLAVTAGGAAITGNITSTGSITAATGLTITLGNLVVTDGDLNMPDGSIVMTHGDVELTLGDVTLTNGDVIIGTATTGITLPGGIRIITGAGAPGGLVAPDGSLYIRTNGGAAHNTTLYVKCTAAWEVVTSA